MRSFEYGDREIGAKELGYAVASIIIGTGILSLPRTLAATTKTSDGWVSIVIGGMIAIIFGWVMAKLASKFPRKSFFEYTSLITSKKIAYILTFLIVIYMIGISSLTTRMLSNVSKLYLFDRTPIEVLALAFLLVIIYAVSGSTTALLRLNLMWLPIIISIITIVQLFNIRFF